jgi:hypothetical protein
MGNMNLTLALDEKDDRLRVLARIFDVAPEDLEDLATRLARAALDEHLDVFSGRRTQSGIRDVRELRLCLMYKSLPPGKPTDEQVAALFRLTRTQATNLVSGARARYGSDLTEWLHREALAAIDNGDEPEAGKKTLRIEASASLAAYLARSVQ